jgi:hypothetical protein
MPPFNSIPATRPHASLLSAASTPLMNNHG